VPCRPFVSSALTQALLLCVLCALQLQDQALAVGEGLLGTESAPVPALSPRRHHVAQLTVYPALLSLVPSCIAVTLLLQDQALAVGEGLLGTETAPVPALSPRRHRIGQTCLRVADGAGRLLKMMHPGKQWGAAAAGGRRTGAPGGVEVEAARRLNRMASLQRAASSIPSV
jgi:hypothetical protein